MIPARTLLAPVDFSDASRASLNCAARLAARWGAALHVVHVLDPLLATAARTRRIDLMAGTRDELEAFCRDAGPEGGVTPILHVLVGSAADAICELAAARKIDLIVGGSRGLSGLNRLMMGTTTEHILRGATTSVLTVPGSCPSGDVVEWGPVIAAIDDPAHPEPIARAAAALAASLGAPLHVVHVVPPLPALARWRDEADAVQHARIEEVQRTLACALRAVDGIAPANVHVSSGPVPDAVAAETSRHTGRLPILVLGRAEPGHGHAPGSVASRVIARATAPVLLYLETAGR